MTCGLAYPAVLNAGAVLRTTARDVRHLDEPGLQRYLKDVGLYAPRSSRSWLWTAPTCWQRI